MSTSPRCIPITAARGNGAGGKAESLARLLALGLPVPDAFVIVDATTEALPDDLELAYENIGRGRVAVRSSASDEDGEAASFAGQHATVLNVEGMPALRDAVVHCLQSLVSERARSYRMKRAGDVDGTGTMNVVVQRMVDTRCAGVVFTADPMTARRDRMIIEAVSGLGGALVGGKVTADHFTLARDGSIVKTESPGPDPCLRHEEVTALASDALRIERHFERPVECEWAIDHRGHVAWLQARPITTLPADPRELDTEPNPADVYTSYNIGEMMPGVATPLTWSTPAHAIDQGMQRMWKSVSSLEKLSEEPFLLGYWFGHLFLNLSQIASIARSMAGGSEADAGRGHLRAASARDRARSARPALSASCSTVSDTYASCSSLAGTSPNSNDSSLRSTSHLARTRTRPTRASIASCRS